MDKRILLLLFQTASLIIFLQACNEEIRIPNLKGNMSGFVFSFDEFGYPLDDHSGARVRIIGLDRDYITNSDADGRFEFTDVPADTYEMHFTKEGYGELVQYGLQHLGGEPNTIGYHPFYCIIEMSTTRILKLTMVNDTLSGTFSFTSQQPFSVSLDIVLSSHADFSEPNDQVYIERWMYWQDSAYSGNLPSFYTEELPWLAGETVYFKAKVFTSIQKLPEILEPDYWNHEMSAYYNYYDFDKNKIIYPNASDESDVFSFVLPD